MQQIKRRRRTRRTRLRLILVGGAAAMLSTVVVAMKRRSRRMESTRPLLVSESMEIARPPEEVFAFVANPLNDAQWTPLVEEVRKTSEGPPGSGSTYEAVFRVLGRHFEDSFEIVEYDGANRKLAVGGGPTSSGALQLTGVRSVEAIPGGARLTIAVEGWTGGFFWLLPDPLFAWLLRRHSKPSLEKIKSILEARS